VAAAWRWRRPRGGGGVEWRRPGGGGALEAAAAGGGGGLRRRWLAARGRLPGGGCQGASGLGLAEARKKSGSDYHVRGEE
jgi:hypothetical protein